MCGAALACGLFAAIYPFVEGWYDLVRADTMFLFLVTAAIGGLSRWSVTAYGVEGHVKVAAGRDYGDVPPLKGIYRGAPSQTMRVSVMLTRLA